MSIYDASMKYKTDKTPLIVLAGAEYGTGSSRDWAAKGTLLLGIRAVIAVSYERIHRSNLVGMGVLPLQFQQGESAQALGLTGEETFDLIGLDDQLQPRSTIQVKATHPSGKVTEFSALVRIDTPLKSTTIATVEFCRRFFASWLRETSHSCSGSCFGFECPLLPSWQFVWRGEERSSLL